MTEQRDGEHPAERTGVDGESCPEGSRKGSRSHALAGKGRRREAGSDRSPAEAFGRFRRGGDATRPGHHRAGRQQRPDPGPGLSLPQQPVHGSRPRHQPAGSRFRQHAHRAAQGNVRVLGAPAEAARLQAAVPDRGFPERRPGRCRNYAEMGLSDAAERRAAPSWLAAFPPARWLANYQASALPRDLVAGITLAAYAIPVSLAYAAMAGLPPELGIYGYLLGGLGYALFGSSRQLAV